jgi:uncharacterized membrane protein YfcA
MLIAGLAWCAAGVMVCMVGLPLEVRLAPEHLILLPLSGVIFLAFYFLVFSRLVQKYTGRIRSRTEDRGSAPLLELVQRVVLGGNGGDDGRRHGTPLLAPGAGLGDRFFYSGLGVALFLCGARILGVFARKDVPTLAPERPRSDS